jgi:hypothetical protein
MFPFLIILRQAQDDSVLKLIIALLILLQVMTT